ncbi:MAG: hypothetical protein RL685_3140 [Pseudomonadota bacterium]|jgi:photosystem II stability/assembly factor-like uncharacterized protein
MNQRKPGTFHSAPRCASLLVGVALSLLAATAAANGRFPRAQRLIQDQLDPNVLALYGTYGLLVTRDAGISWRHVCEAATGPYAGEDSLLEIMAEQRIVLRTDTGLSRSDVSLCSYQEVLGSAAQPLQDITRDSASPNGLLSLSTALGTDGVFVSSLASSSDGGATFSPLASVSPDLIELGLTLDVAASQPDRIYLTGLDSSGRGKLAQSLDRGQSFVGFEIPGLGASAPPYIAAVSAIDPDLVFVRSDVYSRDNNDFEAPETADDSLYVTQDGGQTWHRALNKHGKLYGFALSPDEQWVLAGFGDPVLPAIFVDPEELGLYRVALQDLLASPGAPPWERIYAGAVTCLRWTADALFACVVQEESGFELGRAPDASFSLADPSPFTGLLRLPEVRPLECAAGSPVAACLTEEVTGWLATCSVLRAQCSLEAGGGNASGPSPAPVGGAGNAPPSDLPAAPLEPSGAGSGGAPSAPSSNELEVPGGSSSSAGATPPGAVAPSKPSSGSSCSAVAAVPGTTSRYSALLWLLALLLAVRRRSLLLVLAALSLHACGDEAAGREDAADPAGAADPSATDDCAGAGEDFAIGMSKTTASGAWSVAIVEASPAPPLAGRNSWTVQLSREDGSPLTGADVSFRGWMPRHRHGLTALPLTRELEGGRYEIQPIVLFMPQLWELGLTVTQGDATEEVSFALCVP